MGCSGEQGRVWVDTTSDDPYSLIRETEWHFCEFPIAIEVAKILKSFLC
jgi:hypothetical protein